MKNRNSIFLSNYFDKFSSLIDRKFIPKLLNVSTEIKKIKKSKKKNYNCWQWR